MNIFIAIIQITGFLFAFFVLLTFLPWMISLNGNIAAKDKNISAEGKIKVGSKRFGIAGTTQSKIQFGPFQNPWFQISVKKKAKQRKQLVKKGRSEKKPAMPFIHSAVKTLHWDQFALCGDFGLKNPADTGIIYGGIQACKGLIRSPKIHLDITPVFTHRLHTDLTGSLRFRCIPAVLVWNLTKTYLHFRSKKG
ncbi:MAG: DUF2953 domain-containing protein [Candidatus Marinimicrobia bacterium]|jgi:hypothetical protein|nr:DUF2953 domain-containing protein [Candidatus Neomarinimicrobiota bacterium]MDP6789538.1 DUF2953 domain-containing protein [Candidatus Neomarinimicrobiota bacterium]MDP7072444.1 DUF2953 domain-containing protein [Candidatus Neomarinimicrobiota bacterium]